jgi:hypothetical protein
VRASWVILAGGILVTAAIRGWLASRIAMPWLFSDELVHSELAKNLANGNFFEIRGLHVNVTYAYPLVIAPAWLLSSMGATYAAAKAINVALMCAAALPVYMLGRRFVTPVGAAVAAVLTLLLPELALTGALMQEDLAFPAFLLAVLALAIALEEPTLGHQGLLLGAIALAATARFELLVLVAIVPTAAVLGRAPLRRLAPTMVVTLGAIVAMIAVEAAQPSLIRDALQTFPETSAGYSVGGVLTWFVRTLAALALATGVVPLVALVAVTVRGASRPTERAFLAVTWACVVWFLVLGGLSGSWQPYGLKERYVFYLQPLFLLALVLWAERGTVRRSAVTLAAIVGLALAVAFLPLSPLLTAGSLPGNALGMELFRRLGNLVGFGNGLRALLVVAVVLVGLLALVRARWLVVGLCAAFLVVAAGFAARAADDQARAIAATATQPANRSWVDDAIGKGATVPLLNASNFMPETVRQEIYPVFLPWWETEFWNRSARAVDSLGSPEPLPLAQAAGALDWSTGVVSGVPPATAVLVDPRFEIVGRRRGATSALVLYDRLAAPLRLASAVEGVFRDGETSEYAAYDRWAPGARAVRIAIMRPAGSTPIAVLVRAGALTGGSAPTMGRVTATKDTEVGSGTIVVPVPPAPFRVEVHYGPGVRGTIGFSPSR